MLTLRNFEKHISGPIHGSTRCGAFEAGLRVGTKAQKLAKEKGVPISEVSYESFMALHSKNGEFTYKKTADIAAKVQELAATQVSS
ncbi:hypothetical protein AAHA92_15681 [Salvia divinorum]|uniref:Uncharacterized protein n=1 Tax=Salvia divinorum TaxID=28513 RepID=A0ABD1HFI0_SALDI